MSDRSSLRPVLYSGLEILSDTIAVVIQAEAREQTRGRYWARPNRVVVLRSARCERW